MKTQIHILILSLVLVSCTQQFGKDEEPSAVTLYVLGNVQDAGSPQLACEKSCCENLTDAQKTERKVSSLGIIDLLNDERYLFDASPDLVEQNAYLNSKHPFHRSEFPNAIFLSHAHIGHYTGLMYLGRESANANKTRVYAMPRMDTFLRNNGPWDQLFYLENIDIQQLTDGNKVRLSDQLSVTPLLVPHRAEYSETVGFIIEGPRRKALYIPDIDKWEKWERSILHYIETLDLIFIDGTFYKNGEIKGRDMSEIPHPFVEESMKLFKELDQKNRNKIYFTHLNHTNPLLNPESMESREVESEGFHIARFGDSFSL